MITVNGTDYSSAGIHDIQRSVKRDYKYDVTTEDGVRHTETRALYPVYNVTFRSLDQETYDALREEIMGGGETVTVILPDGQDEVQFEAIAEIGSDAIQFIESNGTVRWDRMIVTFTGVEPLERS